MFDNEQNTQIHISNNYSGHKLAMKVTHMGFDTEKDACNYAYDIAGTKRGSRVVVEGPAVG